MLSYVEVFSDTSMLNTYILCKGEKANKVYGFG